jgi:hypothetical protein
MGENEIAGEGVVLRPVGEDDIAAVTAVMRCPGVLRWWGEFDAEGFAAEIDDPDVHCFVIEHERRGGRVPPVRRRDRPAVPFHDGLLLDLLAGEAR